MKLLFVNACVRGKSRTLRLCREYIKTNWNDGSAEIHELVLSDEGLEPFNRKMLERRDADTAAMNFSAARYDCARDFAEADRILIGAPYWDFGFPALLKVYLEHVCVNKITFGYTEEGAPSALCKAQELIYITTAGGYIDAAGSLRSYWKEMCGLFGIPKLRMYTAEGLDIVGNDAEKIMGEAVLQFAQRGAED